MLRRTGRSQAAVDFMTSYGFAMLIIAIALYTVFQLGVFNYSSSPQYCYSESPFACLAYSINTVGTLTVLVSQSSGGILTITGAACGTTPNTTRIGPRFGNVNVKPYAVAQDFYPNNKLSSAMSLYSGASNVLYVNCYGNAFGPAGAPIGSTFTGYLWLNYTFSGLPSTYHYVSRAASINVKYIQ